MWIRRRQWDEIVALARQATARAADMEQAAAREAKRTDVALQRLRNREDELDRVHTAVVDRERDAAAAIARADFMTLRVNQLQRERDQLFLRAFDPRYVPQIETPQVQTRPTIEPPGVSFDDPAEREGYDVDEIPEDPVDRQDDVTGLTGKTLVTDRRFDPASELGITHPEGD